MFCYEVIPNKYLIHKKQKRHINHYKQKTYNCDAIKLSHNFSTKSNEIKKSYQSFSQRGGGGVRGPLSMDQVPPVFFLFLGPKCAKENWGPFQSGSFSAVSTISVKISSFFGKKLKNCIRSWCQLNIELDIFLFQMKVIFL